MQQEIRDIIGSFNTRKILVIGDAIADIYICTVPDKICREAPVLVYDVQAKDYKCGGAANVAVNAASLGAETIFLTVTGDDAEAGELLSELRSNKVNTDHIIRNRDRKTITKKRVISSSNILLRLDEGSTNAIDAETEIALVKRFRLLYDTADAVIISDYDKGIMTDTLVRKIAGIVRNKPLIIDAKDLRKYRSLQPTAVKPNYDELVAILGCEKAAGAERIRQVETYKERLLYLTGANAVMSTLDADGTVVLQQGTATHHISCMPRNNSKAIGAGDTFISAMALAFAAGAGGIVAAQIAAGAAAVVVDKEGTAGCTALELVDHFDPCPKVLKNDAHLVQVVCKLKEQGKRIVFTNGCFDLIHKGHIYLLENASSFGDVLIAGVNTDKSIATLKGEGRPVNKLEDRMTVLAGFQNVDYIVSFEELSPERLIELIQPDVFVKGGNYSVDNIPEASVLKRNGCAIKIVPYIEDHSTAKIIHRIRDIHDDRLTHVS